MIEALDEQLDRLRAMAADERGAKWDLSPNDRVALYAALDRINALTDALGEAAEMLSRFGADDASARASEVLGEDEVE
jgi:hypothetical protein